MASAAASFVDCVERSTGGDHADSIGVQADPHFATSSLQSESGWHCLCCGLGGHVDAKPPLRPYPTERERRLKLNLLNKYRNALSLLFRYDDTVVMPSHFDADLLCDYRD